MGAREKEETMESSAVNVIEALLDLCSSAAALFAIALAYDSHKKVEQIEKQAKDRSKERGEVSDS